MIPEWVLWAGGILGAALPVLWAFFAKTVFPTWKEERALQRQHEREMAGRRHEMEDASLSTLANQAVAASSQVIESNRLLTEALVNNVDQRLDKIESEIKRLTRLLQEMNGQQTIVTREWTRIVDYLDTINLELNRIDGLLFGKRGRSDDHD